MTPLLHSLAFLFSLSPMIHRHRYLKSEREIVFVHRRLPLQRRSNQSHLQPDLVFPAAVLSQSRNGFDGVQIETKNTDWLIQRYNLTAKWTLPPSAKNLHRKVLTDRIEWLQQRLSWTDRDMATALKRFPGLISLRSEENLEPTIDFLGKTLQISDNDLARVVRRSPSILGRGIGENQSLQRSIKWLRTTTNATDAAIGKMVRMCPSLLTFSVEENLEPTVCKMKLELGLNDKEIAAVIRRSPHFLSYKHSFLERKRNWIQARLCLSDEQLSSMVQRCPIIFALNTNKLDDNILWLRNVTGCTNEYLTRLLLRVPSVMAYSTTGPILEAKIHFLQEQLGQDLALDSIAKSPELLTISLDKRLRPRLEEVQECGIPIDPQCLRRISRYTDDMWAKSLAYQIRTGRATAVDPTGDQVDW